MAIGLTKILVRPNAVEDLWNDPKVLALLQDMGRSIAAAAGPGHKVELDQTQPRPRVNVLTDTFDAMVSEARDHTLTRAFDAARRA